MAETNLLHQADGDDFAEPHMQVASPFAARPDLEEQAIFGQVVVAQSVAMPPLDMKIILDAIEIGKEDGDIATINVQHIQNLIDTITQLRQQVAERDTLKAALERSIIDRKADMHFDDECNEYDYWIRAGQAFLATRKAGVQ
jgi:hypothetical protein